MNKNNTNKSINAWNRRLILEIMKQLKQYKQEKILFT